LKHDGPSEVKVQITELACFRRVNWQPDERERRRFALAMLVGCFSFGAIIAWRAAEIGASSLILWGAGVALAIFALLPRLGRIAYLAIYVPTSLVGYAISNLLLTIIFFSIVTPVGAYLRLRGEDPLQLKPDRRGSTWRRLPKEKRKGDPYRQF
jgi:hypothetical protein